MNIIMHIVQQFDRFWLKKIHFVPIVKWKSLVAFCLRIFASWSSIDAFASTHMHNKSNVIINYVRYMFYILNSYQTLNTNNILALGFRQSSFIRVKHANFFVRNTSVVWWQWSVSGHLLHYYHRTQKEWKVGKLNGNKVIIAFACSKTIG